MRFKNQVTTCSDFPSDALLWIKEVEMVDSLDEMKSSRSVCGKDFPNFEMLHVKIASALNKIIQSSQFKKKVSPEEQKAQKEDRFLRGRQIAFMIYDYFRVTCAHDTVLDYADLFSVTLRWWHYSGIRYKMWWSSSIVCVKHSIRWYILESLYNLRIRESAQLKTVLGIVRHGDSSKDIGSQRSEVENHGEEEYRSETSFDYETFDAWHGRIELGEQW